MRARFLILLTAAALLLMAGCKSDEQPSPQGAPAAPPVIVAPVSGVPREAAWRVPLPEGLTAGQVEGLTVLKGDVPLPVTAVTQGSDLLVTPVKPYERSATLTLRLFAEGKRYEVPFTTAAFAQVASGRVYEVAAAPDQGFNYPYYLYIPDGVSAGGQYRLLVAPLDSGGVSDNQAYHAARARALVEPSAPARLLGDQLHMPVLVPAFVQPASPDFLYSHSLSRAALLLKQGPLVRIDQQLIAMADDARTMLATGNIQLERKFSLTGFGAAGLFADRFALLHPDQVAAVVIGGTSGLITLPVATYQGQTLRYPVGVADIKEAAGIAVSTAAYSQVARFVYLGARDNSDALQNVYLYEMEDAKLVRSLFGEPMLSARWNGVQAAARSLNLPIQFVLYPNLGHDVGNLDDLAAFLQANGGNDPGFHPITPVPERGAVK